jgi:hypothetical protein
MALGRSNRVEKSNGSLQKKPRRGPELGSEDSDASSDSELVALIEYVRHVEPELERTPASEICA